MLFSDRELGPKPRTSEEINAKVWGGIYSAIQKRIDDGSFGYGFPEQCPDGYGISGCDTEKLQLSVQAEIPDLAWTLTPSTVPSLYEIFDLLELLHQNVGKPSAWEFHSYFRHSHLNFDLEEGQQLFRDEINRIMSRNGVAFEFASDGRIQRIAPSVLHEDLTTSEFNTGDDQLDNLLEGSRRKFLDPQLNIRKEALEKLWDAWERLKTLELPSDKKQSIQILLGKAASETALYTLLDTEAGELTRIGNNFMIRHTEVGKIPITESEQVDYLFHRLFSLILLLLRKSGRYSRKQPNDLQQIPSIADDDEIPF